MGRIQKLKLENIKKANELLDKGHRFSIENKKQVFKPSDNVTKNPQSFVDKMENLSEGTRCWKGYKKKGMKTVIGSFSRTKKNAQVEHFYENHSFNLETQRSSEKTYLCDIDNVDIKSPAHIEIL